jgi:type I restriction enzyme S subunit
MNAWRKALLGSVVTFQRGYDLPYRDRRHGTFPVVTSAGITDFHFKPMVDPPGVVTGRYGTIGGLFFIDQPFWPLNTTLYVRDFHGNDPKFTYFLLQQFDFESFSGKSGVPGVNRNDLHKEPVWIPESVAEQTEIANALSDVELLLNELSLIIEKKRHIKQAAMQELLTGKRRLPGFEGEWVEVSIGGTVDLLTGFPFPSSGYSSSGVRLLRGSNVKRGLIDWNEDLAQHWPSITSDIAHYELRDGDIVIAMDGALVGRSYARVQASDLPALLLQRVARIRSSSLCNDFLFYQIGSSRFADHCDSVKTSTAIPHISPADIRNFRALIPPTKTEQIAIAAILIDLDAEISGLEARLGKARELKQGMMQQLLTGKIRLT